MKNSTLILNEDTTVFWLHDLVKHHGVAFDETYIHSHRGLLRHFASNISGFVAYDPSSQSTNAALIRCAAEDGVIAAGTAAMAAFLRDDLKLPMVANLSSSNPFDEFSISKRKLSNRAMVSQPNDGGKSNCLSEYAVFARIPTMEHNTDPSKPPSMMKGFQAVLDNFDQTALNAAYGWTSSDEHAFTASVTSAGGMVHASDFAYNMAVLSQLPPYVHANAPAARKRMDAGARSTKQVHTVAFVNSDGDNLQLLQKIDLDECEVTGTRWAGVLRAFASNATLPRALLTVPLRHPQETSECCLSARRSPKLTSTDATRSQVAPAK